MKITLRKITKNDLRLFNKWWRDVDLIKLTSGDLRQISDKQIFSYFKKMLNRPYDFIIQAGKTPIGHISLSPRQRKWFETQIIIGKRNYRNKGYGTKTIKILLRKAQKFKINKIYLEVRPDNLRAIKAYEKCGFKQVRIIRYPKNKYLSKTLRMEFRSE